MASYRNPKFTIQQQFAVIPSAIVEPLQTCIVGPSKRVFEYSNVTDKSIIAYGAYDYTAANTFDYAGLPTAAVVDESSVGLIIEELWALYAEFYGSELERGSAANRILYAAGSGNRAFASSTALARNAALLQNRDVQVGDRVRVVANSITLDTRVVSLASTNTTPSAGVFTNGTGNLASRSDSAPDVTLMANGDHNATASAALYTGSLAGGFLTDVYVVTCTTGGVGAASVWSVTSTKRDNLIGVAGVALASPMTIGSYGLTMTIFGTGAYVAGESYRVTPVAQYDRVTPTIVGSSGEDYSGAIDTIYTVKVVQGGDWDDGVIKVSVSTNNGVDYSAPVSVYENISFNLGTLGIVAKFPIIGTPSQDGLLADETYLVSVTASAAGPIDQIVLADAIDSSIVEADLLDVSFHIYRSSFVVPVSGYPESGSEALTTTDSDFTVAAGLEITESTWNNGAPIPVVQGNIFAPYTALLTVGAEDFDTISELSEVETVLGKPIPANPLAYGVYKALENSNGQPVNYVSVLSDDVSGFGSALGALEKHEQSYFVVPLTTSLEIQNLYKAHVLAMSDINHQFERVLLVSRPLSTTVAKYGAKTGGGYWMGSLASNGGNPVKYTHLYMEDANFLTDGIRAGDSVRINFGVDSFGVETYDTYVVATITDGQNLVLVSGPVSAYSTARIDIIRNLTKAEQAAAVAASSGSFDNRRVYSVWPDLPIDDAGREVPGHFLACSIAGLKSSVAPHQGVTHYTLNGWSSVARSFKYFTPTQLDILAGGGTLIITQDESGGEVYVRHQVSSDNTDANTSELSITTNLDSITKFIRGDLKNFIGKYNSGEHFESIVHAMIAQKISYLQTQTITETAGAQVTSFDVASLVVKQDPLIRTTVNASASIGLPYPVNNFDFVLTVI